jgi:hypothetical protein
MTGGVPVTVPVESMLTQLGPETEYWYEPLPPETGIVMGVMGDPSEAVWFPGLETDSTGEHWAATLAVAEWPDGAVTVSVSPISKLPDVGVTESEAVTMPPAATDLVTDPVLVPLERAQW